LTSGLRALTTEVNVLRTTKGSVLHSPTTHRPDHNQNIIKLATAFSCHLSL